MKIKFFKDKFKRLDCRSVFLVDMESDRTGEVWPGQLTGYLPIGQHGAIPRGYIKDYAIEITKEQYLKASEGIYTPEVYLI
jgi:hypothetical protein